MPFEVPSGWEWCEISEIAQSNIGLTYKPSDVCPDGVPVMRSSNIQDRNICLEDVVRVNTIILEKQFLNVGDLLICSRNGSRSLVGKCAIIKELTEKTSFGAFMAVCRSEYNSWIDTVLNSEYFAHYLDDSNSTTIYQVTQKMLLEFRIPLPPLAEQQRIVTEIERWFDVIDALEANEGDLQKTIEQTKKKILDLAIRGKLVPQDPNDEPAGELLKRLGVSSDNRPYENVPTSWAFTNLGSVFQHNTGKALNKSASQEGTLMPYITTSNVYWDCFELDNVKQMCFKDSEIDKCTVKKGDLLVCEGGDIGRSAIWPFDYTICIQNHIHRLRPKFDVSVKFYYFVLMLYKSQNSIEGKGIGMLGLSSGQLDKLMVPVPPVNEQKRIVDKVEELFSQLDTIAKALE